jgi:hypothetical protein
VLVVGAGAAVVLVVGAGAAVVLVGAGAECFALAAAAAVGRSRSVATGRATVSSARERVTREPSTRSGRN